MSQTDGEPTFDQLADMFMRLGALHSPSRLQGYISGLIAVHEAPAPALWPDIACSVVDSAHELQLQDRPLLESLLAATEQALAGESLAYRLLLPDDDEELVLRLDSLGQWCQGFLAGFALGGKQYQQQHGRREYSPEISELLGDIAAIAQVDASQGEQAQDEQALFELIEYLRVAVMNIFLECHTPAVASPDTPAGEDEPQQLH